MPTSRPRKISPVVYFCRALKLCAFSLLANENVLKLGEVQKIRTRGLGVGIIEYGRQHNCFVNLVVAVQEGLAHLCLIGSATTIQKAKIEMSLPRKRGAAAAGYDTAYTTFLNRASSVQTCLLLLATLQMSPLHVCY